MSIEFIFRLIGMVVFAIVGWRIGDALSAQPDRDIRFILVLLLAGAALGLLITPWITLRPYRWFRRQMRRIPAPQLLAATIGLIIGLIIATLTAFPLSLLPAPFSNILPFVSLILFGYIGAWIMTMRERDIFSLFGGRFAREGIRSKPSPSEGISERTILLDTSVIIDGRIADVSRTGFLDGVLTIPRFVLNELQHIADSSDALRRNRGRRGLDMLNKLQKESVVPIKITDMDVEEVREVDDKLVRLAKQLRAPVLTNDFNLNKVAEIQGVRVLNVNELANALRAIVLPGENMHVKLVQDGKELGQGVAYLDDGTMVVVENGKKYMGSSIDVTVTRMLQTNQGRMIFATPANGK